MADRSDVDWKTCVEDECVGVRLSTGDRCWAHAERHDVNTAREGLRSGGRLDARGVTFTAELLQHVLTACPDDKGAVIVTDAAFQQATFTDTAWFRGVTFKGQAAFGMAKFKEGTWFDGANFADGAWFSGTVIEGHAGFRKVTFKRTAWFDGVTITGGATFDGATFGDDAWFSRASFRSYAGFDPATFTGTAWFDEATFTDDAAFGGAVFTHDARFHGATFTGDARFYAVTFERARQLGPMAVRKSLFLDGVLARERIRIEVSAPVLSCKRARFLAGAQLRVRWAQVVLDDADVAAPSVLSGADPFDDLLEDDRPRMPDSANLLDDLLEDDRPRMPDNANLLDDLLEDDRPRMPDSRWPIDADGTPRLLSVRGADVAGLTVAGVDLRACRFVGAYHLDQLRAEGSTFANTPRGWHWTRRRTIAEEHQWRAGRRRSKGWHDPAQQPPEWLEVKTLNAAQIAPLYRELRKGLEDSKDEPGAADFYYGEMEMRRHAKRQQAGLEWSQRNRGAATAAATEGAILWLYWLVSGYGLRAWRALTSLGAVVLVASVIFAFWGFAEPDPFPTALRYSAQATTALLRGPSERPLTEVGEWLQIVLRLIGPVLLGLAVLSVRGRVKR
jgi:uncharacterized protein YjbI with pentapeptide repeats